MAGETKTQGSMLHISEEGADVETYAEATFVKVGLVRSIGEPDGEAAEIDTTSLESVSKESLMGLPDNGKISVSGFMKDTDLGQIQMRTAKDTQQRRWIKVTLSNGAIRYFPGLVLKFADFSAEPDGVVPFNASIRVSGAVTRVPAV